jgi:hypothetical protein
MRASIEFGTAAQPSTSAHQMYGTAHELMCRQAVLSRETEIAFELVSVVGVNLLWDLLSGPVFAALSASEDAPDRVQQSTSVPRTYEHQCGLFEAS